MVVAVCDRVQCSQDTPVMKVFSAESDTLEARGTDSSIKLTLTATTYPLMYYFLRFFKSNTSHRLAGTYYTYNASYLIQF